MKESDCIEFIRVIKVDGKHKAVVRKAHWSNYEEKKPPAGSQVTKMKS